MKEIETKAIEGLIVVYGRYCDEGLSEGLIAAAKDVYDEYHPAKAILSADTHKAVSKLFAIAYEDSGSGIEMPSKEEAEEILRKLKED